MNPFIQLSLTWASMALLMAVFYLIQRKTQNATLVDAVWSAGVGLAGCFYAAAGQGDPGRRILLALLTGLWGFRLAAYLIVRSAGKPEDGRYAMLREKWADRSRRNFFLLYQAQAFWVVLFSIPFLPVAGNGRGLWTWHDLAGVAIWILAVAGEAVADWQLHRFRRQSGHAGKTCREGLWRYSRHPNYFFEWVHWFTYVFLAVGSAWWWLSLWGPVVMLLFLYKLTGIPYTEERALQRRGEDYRQYQKTTSPFIPWFPRRTHETNH